jgi:hypothetical protein
VQEHVCLSGICMVGLERTWAVGGAVRTKEGCVTVM